jgi:hypothetical protein
LRVELFPRHRVQHAGVGLVRADAFAPARFGLLGLLETVRGKFGAPGGFALERIGDELFFQFVAFVAIEREAVA